MADARFLSNVALFAELNEDQRAYLAAKLTVRKLTTLDTLFWVGDSGDDMFIIHSGRIEVCIPDSGGKEIRLAVLGSGEILGELSLLDGGTRSATARALEDTELLCLGREDFLNSMLALPQVAINVFKVLSMRQRQTVEKLRGIRNLNEVLDDTMTPWQRLAFHIAEMASSQRFLLTHATCFGLWILVNTILRSRAIDPFPFPFLCFWASVEAIFLSLFILISQDMQGQKDRIRNEVEYQVALKLQLEMMQLHQKMDDQNTRLEQIAKAIVPGSPPAPSQQQ